jgi:hypothetical protein
MNKTARDAVHNAAVLYRQLLEAYRRDHDCKQVPREYKEEALTRAADDAERSFGVRPENARIRRLAEKGDRPRSMHRARRK